MWRLYRQTIHPNKIKKTNAAVQAPPELPDEFLGFVCVRRRESTAHKAHDDQPCQPHLERRPI